MAQFEINKNKEYHFPIITKVVRFDNKILVIATEYANWIVLDSTEQLSVLEFLKQGHTIQDCFLNSFKEDDINYVVCQIEARQLCNKQVHSSVEDERSMHLYLTNKCNLFCPHCYMYSGQKTQEELTTEQIKKLIYDYKTIANGTRLTISGGEPTIRSDFEQIIIYA